ncbi:hypoxanthine phosphoribosyltransferase [Guggenheimella bovis]
MENHNVLFSKEDIQKKVDELGSQITKDYEGKNLLIIGLLKGSFVFVADLMRAIKQPAAIEFMTTSSYVGDTTETSGKVRIVHDVEKDLTNFDVIIVDDIIDSGLTMSEVYKLIKERLPKSLKTCVLLDKPSRRQVDFKADYTGFEIEDQFIVGYGLNYGDHFRNVDHIFVYEEEK